jgi:uncharacterized protein YceK
MVCVSTLNYSLTKETALRSLILVIITVGLSGCGPNRSAERGKVVITAVEALSTDQVRKMSEQVGTKKVIPQK